MNSKVSKREISPDAEAPDYSTKSFYDPEETPEEDLWFLPGAPADQAPTDPPLPMAGPGERTPRGLDTQSWLTAETEAGRLIAEASAAFARYDERLSRMPDVQERIALMCVSAALEVQGDWLPAERIALYVALRERTGDEAQQLSQADWALRRLLGGFDPRDDLNGYLGRHPSERDGLIDLDLFGEPARGDEFAQLSRSWLVALEELADAGVPPLILSAAAFHMWRSSDISTPGEVVDAAILASALGVGNLRTARFLPVLLGQRQHLLARGSAVDRLTGWMTACRDGCNRALMELAKVENWQGKALENISDLSGKTPPLIIEVMATSWLASADMLSQKIGASKAAIRRNMAEFETRGIVREITGQGRYRFWRIAT